MSGQEIEKAFADSECSQMDDKEAIFRWGWHAGRKAKIPELLCGECGKPMRLVYDCDTPNCVENPNRVMPREDY